MLKLLKILFLMLVIIIYGSRCFSISLGRIILKITLKAQLIEEIITEMTTNNVKA